MLNKEWVFDLYRFSLYFMVCIFGDLFFDFIMLVIFVFIVYFMVNLKLIVVVFFLLLLIVFFNVVMV